MLEERKQRGLREHFLWFALELCKAQREYFVRQWTLGIAANNREQPLFFGWGDLCCDSWSWILAEESITHERRSRAICQMFHLRTDRSLYLKNEKRAEIIKSLTALRWTVTVEDRVTRCINHFLPTSINIVKIWASTKESDRLSTFTPRTRMGSLKIALSLASLPEKDARRRSMLLFP